MRRYMTMAVGFMVVVLLVLPTALGRLFGQATPGEVALAAPDGSDSLPISVFFPDTGEIEQLALGEYLKGVVAAEMPPDFADEALKAQFVVARTYAVRRMRQFAGPGKGGCPLKPQADVCADHNTSQAYLTYAQMEERWGKAGAAAFWKRLTQVQQETEGVVVRYRGELIDPLYHSVSGIMTEDAGEYFQQSLPYLRPVDDHWGAYSPKLKETRQFALSELVGALSTPDQAIPVSAVKGASAPVQIVARTTTGRVKTVKVGGVTMSGREFRERLGLRSNNFSVKVQGERVTVETTGYGHGVGMSQYGANGMALADKTYEEILTYYYKGVSLSRLFGE